MGTVTEGIPYWSGCVVTMMSSSCFKTQNWRIQQNVEYSKCYWQQNTEYSKVLNLARITKSWKQGKVSVPRASSGRTLCSLLSNLLLPSTTLPRHQPTFMKQSKYKYKNIRIQIYIQQFHKYKYTLLLTLLFAPSFNQLALSSTNIYDIVKMCVFPQLKVQIHRRTV